MSLSFSNEEQQSLGSVRGVTGIITFDSSYPTGGEPFVASDIGLGEILSIGINQGEDGYVFHWDRANDTIIVYESAGANAPLTEVANLTDLSGVVVEFIASGR